ncbi:hypothetical protein GCM10027040_13520 [Halomonas shantousis]
MSWLEAISNLLERACRYIAGLGLLAVMLVTVADVGTRYLFKLTSGYIGLTISGSVELVSYLLLVSLLAAMAANVEKSQVVVEAFTHKLPESVKRRIAGLYLLGFFAVGSILAWGLWEEGVSAAQFGEVTQDLAISMGPIYKASAVLSMTFALRCLIQAVLGMVYSIEGENVHEL